MAFLDNVNLIFHEAGHMLFIPFGDFLHVLGGSLTQVLIPLVCSGYFFVTGQSFSGSLLLSWAGQNLINVSVYASDALVMQLPLLGGDSSGHDWNYLLFQTHTLRHTAGIANTIFIFGILVLLGASILSFYFATHDKANNTFSN